MGKLITWLSRLSTKGGPGRRRWEVRVGWPNSSAAPKGDGYEWGWGFAWEVRDGGRGGGLEAGTRPFY